MIKKINLLDIKDPSFVHNLSKKELKELASDIREFLIESLSHTGGHLASNLGVVELTLVLHKIFDSPKDRFVFDVGHQTYTHKILTGRANQFSTLRKTDGLSGYAKREESPHDHFEAGHSSTSISAISGFLCADNDNYNIAIIGDASIAGGLSFEGLNYLGGLKNKKAIVVLNDNKMAISQSVGAIPNLFSKIRGSGAMIKIKRVLYKISPNFVLTFCQLFMRGIRIIFRSENMFEHMGFAYMGPVDGNDINSVMKVLAKAKKLKRPCVVHLMTEKGKGYQKAEADILGDFHGVGPFDVKTGLSIDKCKKITWSQIICHCLIEIKKKQDVLVIVPAMINGSKLGEFQRLYPDNLIDVGIAEEHAVTMASAASLVGRKVFVAIYSTFAQRAYDQILHDCSHHNANVVFGIDRSGIVGEDGETHQGIYDIAMFGHIPNVEILSPHTPNEAMGLLVYAFKQNHPVAIRYPRGDYDCNLNDIKEEIIDEKWTVLKEGKKAIVISYGPLLNDVLAVSDNLDIMIINARFIKPYDKNMLDKVFSLDSKIICFEEVIKEGSLGVQILEYANEKKCFVDLEMVNLGSGFIPHGEINEIKKRYKLDAQSIKEKIEEFL